MNFIHTPNMQMLLQKFTFTSVGFVEENMQKVSPTV